MKPISREQFQPDYNNVLQVLNNHRPQRLPLYEHHIDLPFIARVLGKEIVPQTNKRQDCVAHYREVIGFWRDMTYDAFDYEAASVKSSLATAQFWVARDPFKRGRTLTSIRLTSCRRFSGVRIDLAWKPFAKHFPPV